MQFLPEKLDAYIAAHTQPEPKILQDLDRETHLKTMLPQMLSGHQQGQFLTLLSKIVSPKRILEIGTFTGYSAICWAQGLTPTGKLHTIDIDEEYTTIAARYFKRAKLDKKIVQHIGKATEIIPKMDEVFDIAYIDADKENYPAYFKLALKKVRPGGLIVADNALWSGKVINNRKDGDTSAIAAFNDLVLKSKAVENVLLPLRDGLMVARLK
jgi:predicted O-methyltransferase YrrM